MDHIILHILIGFGLSFIGSVPVGMINITVAETTIQKGLRAGLFVAAGAVFVEFFQTAISLKFTTLFKENPMIENGIQWFSIVVFIGLGIYFLRSKSPEKPQQQIKQLNNDTGDFFKGILISSFNIIVFPYWVFYATYLSTEGWLGNYLLQFSFAIGVVLGSFAVFYLYARLSLRVIKSFDQIAASTNKILAGLFFIFAVIQLFRVAVA